jgi:hypothetical protein
MRIFLVLMLACGLTIAGDSLQQQDQDVEYALILLKHPKQRYLAKALMEQLEDQNHPQAGRVRGEYQATMTSREMQIARELEIAREYKHGSFDDTFLLRGIETASVRTSQGYIDFKPVNAYVNYYGRYASKGPTQNNTCNFGRICIS